MTASPPRFRAGDEVRRRSAWDKVGTIIGEPRLLAGEYWYTVRFDATDRPQLPESDLEPHEGGHDLESMLFAGRFGSREAFSKLITFTRLRQRLTNHLYSMFASRTEYHPYQFKPLLKFLGSQKGRLLIADEVGLGKTIEAGLIMIEERARHGLERVLVVCPAALCEKWRAEMRHRFEEEFTVLDAVAIRRFLDDSTRWGEHVRLRGIVSFQTLRSRPIQTDWEAAAPPLDLVIIDEAHHFRNPHTRTHQVGRLLSETAAAMLLLTATPIHLGNENLFYLLRLLDPDEFQNLEAFKRRLQANKPIVEAQRILARYPPDFARALRHLRQLEHGPEREYFLASPFYRDVVTRLDTCQRADLAKAIELQRDLSRLSLLGHILTRTRKAEVHVRVRRQARRIPVQLSSLEIDFYHAVSRHVFERYAALGANTFAAWAAIMPQRQVASCIPAMVEYYSEVLGIAGSDLTEVTDIQPEDLGELDPDSFSADALLPDLKDILRRFAGVARLDTKFDRLIEALQILDQEEPGCKVVIFSYFKRTLEYLSRRLRPAGFPALVIHGGYPDEERQRRIAEFRDNPSIRILLSSEVGSEGLDFQFCHILVNYDLPWNPMVVEQRIGRLDRFGQPFDKVLILNFEIPGTIEDRILRRLYERIRIFEESIGELETILGDQIGQLTRELLQPDLTDDEKEERIRRAAEVIERARQDQVELEDQSRQFLGTDAFFDHELRRIEQHRRYVAHSESLRFVKDFLAAHFPDCSLTHEDNGRLALHVSEEFEHFLRDHLPPDDAFLRRFFRRVTRGKVRLTFDASLALMDHEVEFITNTHPIIRAICRWYDRHRDELHPISALVRQTNRLSPGHYLYSVHLVEATGARPSRSLEAIFAGLTDSVIVAGDEAEDLMSELVTLADTTTTKPNVEPSALRAALQRIDQALGERISAMRSDLSRLNDVIVSQRVASLRQSFAGRIEKREQLLARARHRGAAPQYIRMLEGSIRNAREEWAHREAELERGRSVNVSFTTIALGILEVPPR
jgi:superfamily II DNA or RNA helicase